ncbi:BrnA antitoxin family protein [Ancylobacter sp. G4_0304]|uniref:BrnA antitoxin family protein n=1 Tax=Ancylobacter sp. G4_0304 TaxID=3114289 RepID=UPI0039C70A33
MANTPTRRSTGSTRDTAEAAFKSATTKPVPPAEPVSRTPFIPGAKEQVSIRLDRDVLERFQEDGPGWQERINAALRKALGM